MLQVIQILAYACFYNPPLLLLDEPDAHLHADSQTRLHSALRGLVEKTNTRIVLATHSPQLIQLMLNDSLASIIWMDKGCEVKVLPGQRPAIPLLMELGALTVGADVFDPTKKVIILTEDNEPEMVKLFAKANGVREFACLSYNGCGNLTGARQLAVLLCELRPDVRVVIHRDRDFRTEAEQVFEMLLAKTWYKSNECERVEEVFTPHNDIEHSFLHVEHLSHVLEGVLAKDRIEFVLKEAINVKRDDITGRIRSARDVVKSELYDPERMKKKVALREKAGISDNPPKINMFLPVDGNHDLKIEQCHGKAVYNSFITKLHGELRGDSKLIPGLVLKESPFLVSKQWCDALTF